MRCRQKCFFRMRKMAIHSQIACNAKEVYSYRLTICDLDDCKLNSIVSVVWFCLLIWLTVNFETLILRFPINADKVQLLILLVSFSDFSNAFWCIPVAMHIEWIWTKSDANQYCQFFRTILCGFRPNSIEYFTNCCRDIAISPQKSKYSMMMVDICHSFHCVAEPIFSPRAETVDKTRVRSKVNIWFDNNLRMIAQDMFAKKPRWLQYLELQRDDIMQIRNGKRVIIGKA